MGRGDIMTWQNILLKQLKFPVDIADWVGIFKSENTLNKFKRVLQQYVVFGPNELQGANDRTLLGAKSDLKNIKDFADTIVSEAGFDNKPILGEQPTGKKSDRKITNQVESHLKEILDSMVGSFGFGTTKSELIKKLLDSIGPKLKTNNPNYLEIEKEIYNFLEKTNSINRPSIIKEKLTNKLKGKITQLSEGIEEHHLKNNNIPYLYKLFQRSVKGKWRPDISSFSDAENLIKFYRAISIGSTKQTRNITTTTTRIVDDKLEEGKVKTPNRRGNVAGIQKILRKEVGSLYPHLYKNKEPTEEFKKVLRGEPVSLKGFERFGYVDVPISEVNVDIFEDAIKDKKILWIPIDEAEDALDEDPPDGIKGLVGDIGKGKPIVVNGKSILSGNKLPSEKKEVLDEFNKFTDKQDKDLKYWAFNNISKVEDWETLTVKLIHKFLKDDFKNKNVNDILVNLGILVEEGE